MITKSKVWGTGKYAPPPAGTRGTNAKNLDTFDAVFFFGVGEGTLSAEQKRDLLAFVHDDGKGFVGAHTAIYAFYEWSEFGEMMGCVFREPSLECGGWEGVGGGAAVSGDGRIERGLQNSR